MFKPKRLIGISIVIIALAAAIAGFIRLQYVVPVVMYHSVSDVVDHKNRTHVSTAVFERQMRFLKNHHYNVIPLAKAAEFIINKKKIPAKTIAITFDDGYKNNYTHAYPILKKYNLPAAIFIILDEVGRPQGDRLDWAEIKEMRASGLITIGSHALGPEPLINYKSEEMLRRQIFDSKRLLEQNLGAQVDIFSYPGGMFNAEIRRMVIDAGYKLAAATNPGKDYPSDDIFAIKRLRISENAGDLFVFGVETSGFYTFMKEHRHK
ncbi:MAG: polysaccharide deacetylase family protein [Candidatus Omnitrophota bacterium]|nr:polysaccharide deacetylase family protein [Candidatus Omnitrophota bacterium]